MIRAPRWLVLTGFWIPLVFTTYAAFAPHGVPMPFQVSDIILHASAFTYLTAALWFAHHGGDRGWKPALWMMAYGVGIEAIQSLEPTRSAELGGIESCKKAISQAGITLGLALYRWVVSRLFFTLRAMPRDQITSPSP